MKALWIASLALASFLLPFRSAVWAGEGQPIRAAKVAVVRIERVFDEYEYIKDCQADIENRFRDRRAQLENLRRQFETEAQRVQNDPLMRPGTPEFEKKQMDMRLKQMEIQTESEKYLQEVNRENAAVMVRFYDAFRTACQLACGYYQVDILLSMANPNLPEEARREGAPAPAIQQDILRRSVLYARGDVDITDGILYYLNSAYQAHKQDRARPMFPVAPK